VAEALEERIIVPEDTLILMKEVESPQTTAPRRKAPQTQRKRVRFNLPKQATLSSDSDEDSEATQEEDWQQEDDKDESDEEENMGDIKGCGHCGTAASKEWHEDEDSGKFLCDQCHDCERRTGSSRLLKQKKGSQAAAGSTGGICAAVSDDAGAGEKACYNCGTTEARHFSQNKENGQWECTTCYRYRENHDGAERPARLFKRKRAKASTAATSSALRPMRHAVAQASTLGASPAVQTPLPGARGRARTGQRSWGQGRGPPLQMARYKRSAKRRAFMELVVARRHMKESKSE